MRHPERVSHLILYGGFALGAKKRSPQEKEKREAMGTLMRLGWGGNNPSFRQMFTAQFVPGGTQEQSDAFNELQRRTTSPECAARYFDIVGDLFHGNASVIWRATHSAVGCVVTLIRTRSLRSSRTMM